MSVGLPRAGIAIVLLSLLLGSTRARADASSEAKRLAQRAAAAFDAGRYREAAETWEKAQALKPTPLPADPRYRRLRRETGQAEDDAPAPETRARPNRHSASRGPDRRAISTWPGLNVR